MNLNKFSEISGRSPGANQGDEITGHEGERAGKTCSDERYNGVQFRQHVGAEGTSWDVPLTFYPVCAPVLGAACPSPCACGKLGFDKFRPQGCPRFCHSSAAATSAGRGERIVD